MFENNGNASTSADRRTKMVELVCKYAVLDVQAALLSVKDAANNSSLTSLIRVEEATGDDPFFETIDETSGSMFNTSTIKRKVDGTNVTSHSITCVHSRCPFQANLSGSIIVHGLHGESLPNGYNDLSHMGIGLRHRPRLMALPSLYTAIYQQVCVSDVVVLKCVNIFILTYVLIMS